MMQLAFEEVNDFHKRFPIGLLVDVELLLSVTKIKKRD